MADLERAQEELGKALSRASMGEDRDLANQVRESGEQLARMFTGALRLTRTHDAHNEAFIKPIQEIGASLDRLLHLLGVVHLVTVDDQVYVNDIRIRMDDEEGGGSSLGRRLSRHNVGGLSFHGKVSFEHMRSIVQLVAGKPHERRPRGAVRQALTQMGATTIDVHGLYRLRVAGDDVHHEHKPEEVRANVSRIIEEFFENMRAGRVPNPLPARRVVTDLLEMGLRTPELWESELGGTPFNAHTVRVCVLSMLVGQELCLGDEAEQDLGVSALFHDVGYASVNEYGRPPSYGFHGSRGARMLLLQRGFHPAKLRRALTALEHSQDHKDKPAWLFGRIVRVCSDYDNLVHRAGHEPVAVLEGMAGLADEAYDPTVFQALVNALGRYPPGTRLKLGDGRVVLVASPPAGKIDWALPTCRVERTSTGREPGEPEWVTLTAQDKARIVV